MNSDQPIPEKIIREAMLKSGLGDLLPCPFCGLIPNLILRFGRWIIQCKDMGCIVDEVGSHKNKFTLKAAWNNRKFSLIAPPSSL